MAGRAIQVELLLAGVRDTNGQPVNGGKIYTYDAGTLNARTTWTDVGKATPAANPIVLDANGKAQIYADGAYKFVIKTSADVTLYTYDNLLFVLEDGTTQYGGTSSGGANTYSVSTSPATTSYVAGQRVTFKAHQTNTSSVTVNVNSVGSVALNKLDGVTALAANDILQNGIVDMVHDGTRFVFNSPVTDQSSSRAWGGTSGGSANAQTISLSPAITAYSAGQVFRFIAGFTNTSGTTLNVNSVGAKTIKIGTNALKSNVILAGKIITVVYDGTDLQLIDQVPFSATWTPTITGAGAMTFTGVTINIARYWVIGDMCAFTLRVTVTQGGTPNNEAYFTLPLNGIDNDSYHAHLQEAGGRIGGFGYNSSTTLGAVRYYNSANFNAVSVIEAAGHYRI